MGNYTRHLTLSERLDYYIDKTPVGPMGCHLWIGSTTGFAPHKYGCVWDGTKQRRAHREVWRLANPGKPEPPVVRHKCDVSLCCNPKHLIGGTQQNNIHDMFRRKRRVIERGIGNPNGHLTDEQVMAIFKDPRRQVDIAAAYGCAQTTVSRIKRGERQPAGYAGVAAECSDDQ